MCVCVCVCALRCGFSVKMEVYLKHSTNSQATIHWLPLSPYVCIAVCVCVCVCVYTFVVGLIHTNKLCFPHLFYHWCVYIVGWKMVITTVYIYVHECVCVCVVKKSWLDCVLLTKALPAKQYSTILCVWVGV